MDRIEENNLSAVDDKIRKMIGDLPAVEPPKDFDFRLKARIANASPKAYRSNAWRPAIFAVPALALILLLGLFAFKYRSGAPDRPLPVVAAADTKAAPSPAAEPVVVPQSETASVKAPQKLIKPLAGQGPGTTTASKPAAPVLTAASFVVRRRNTERGNTDNGSAGSYSRDSAATDPGVMFPRGLDPRRKIETPRVNEDNSSIPVKSVLQVLGIDAANENGVWRVKSVSPNGEGGRAGVKVNDTVDAIDGKKMSDAGNSISVKKLNISRGAEKLELTLNNAAVKQ
jgi:hypothetical protein